MYNFSGLLYRIFGVCGVILLVGIVCILLEKPWKPNVRVSDCKLGLIIIIASICLILVYTSRMLHPGVSSYVGQFVESHRNSRVAPPLPVTYEYIFWNGEGSRQVFYLDIFSLQEIFPDHFKEGQCYKIYFDTFTNIIVEVDVVS